MCDFIIYTIFIQFSFVRLFKGKVEKVVIVIANAYELKQVSLARCNTDKLCRILKAQVLSGEQLAVPVTLPPVEIQGLRGLFTMLKKGEYHYGRDAAKHEAKMAEYRRFLEKGKNIAV